MAHKKVSKSVMDQIQSGKIKQKPKLYFVSRNLLFWFIYAVSIVVGARVFGSILHILYKADLGMLLTQKPSIATILLTVLPLFWVVFFMLFMLLAMAGLHHTRKGYKMTLGSLVSINLIISLAFGGVSFAIGDAKRFERATKFLPMQYTAEQHQRGLWQQAERGRLGGYIISVDSETALILEDLTGSYWTVDVSDAQKTGRLSSGQKIKVMGEMTGKEAFKARFIAHWEKSERK